MLDKRKIWSWTKHSWVVPTNCTKKLENFLQFFISLKELQAAAAAVRVAENKQETNWEFCSYVDYVSSET